MGERQAAVRRAGARALGAPLQSAMPSAKRDAKKAKRAEAGAGADITGRHLGVGVLAAENLDGEGADKNPFVVGGVRGAKEHGLRPKAEEPGRYSADRPWTPTTGEDFLLATQPKGFYPSSTIYPRPQTRAQRFVGARREAFSSPDGEARLSLSASPARLKPIAFQKVAPLRDDGFFPVQKKVLIKDHRRGGMTGYAGLEGPSFSFASLALTLETELLEFRNDPARKDESQPSLQAAEKSLALLGRIAERPGPFQKVLLLIREHLTQSIFSSTDIGQNVTGNDVPSPRTSGSTETLPAVALPAGAMKKEVSVPYFWLYQQAAAKLNKLQQELDEMRELDADAQETHSSGLLAFKGTGDSASLTSPGASSRASSPSSPKSRKKQEGPTAEEKMFEKLLEMQKEKEKAEDRMEEMAVQTNTMEWELEAKFSENEQLLRETTELKGSFLRMKSDCMDLRAALSDMSAQNDRHFNQLQNAVSKHEHEHIVQEYEKQLAAQEDKTARLLHETFGEDGAKIDEVMKTMTPRPNWRRTGATKQILMDCSIFARTDSSAEGVDKLLHGYMETQRKLTQAQARVKELEGEEDDESTDGLVGWSGMQVTASTITCMGMGSDVPLFLRYNGQVRNQKMRKGEAERHVRAVWHAKAEHDEQLRIMHDKPPSKLDDFIIAYAKGKFNNNPKIMAEWKYNLVVALRENSQDTDCDLFLKILMNEVSEDVYHDEMGEMEDAIFLAQNVDRKENDGKLKGICSKEGFLHAIRDRFHKSFEDAMELKKALDVVHGSKNPRFEYGDLFADDRDLSQNEFAEEFRMQSIRDRHLHADKLKKLVLSSRQTDGDKLLELKTFESGLRMLDPKKTEQDFNIYMRRGADVGPKEELPELIQPERFIHNLLSHGVVKPGTLARLETRSVNLHAATGNLRGVWHALLCTCGVCRVR